MKKITKSVVILVSCMFSWQLHANPVVCVSTNEGKFCMELFERQTPVTVTNFLGYINRDDYTGSIFHRSMPGFVLQGGGFSIEANENDGVSLVRIAQQDPIINEFGISNTRRTVAMAKLGGDPDSATNQWFVNLANNAANLDNQNGGFTVFGQVIFDGMQIIDAIANLPVVNFGGVLANTPTRNFDGQNPTTENFIRIETVTVSNPVGIYDQAHVTFPVLVDDNSAYAVQLDLVATEPSFVFKLNTEKLTQLQLDQNTETLATFSSQSGQLVLPSVMINDSTILRNVVMKLTNAAEYEFILESFDQ